jgi:hypothetical protein
MKAVDVRHVTETRIFMTNITVSNRCMGFTAWSIRPKLCKEVMTSLN